MLLNMIKNYTLMNVKVVALTSLLWFSLGMKAQQPLYKCASAPVEERVVDLMSRMTPEEKVGQLLCPMGWEMYTKKGRQVEVSDKYKQLMGQGMPVGSFWAVLRADPWTQKTLQTGLNPALAAKAMNKLQQYAVEETRLGIPVLFAEECPHGHMAIGTTVMPTGLAMASTWDKELLAKVGEVVALEARLQGANIGYGPVLDIARDPRWSRMEETFGEDPYLTSELGVAYMTGLQGEKVDDGKHVYATLKHFAAYGIPEGGHNGGPAMVGTNKLFTDYLPPFKKAVEAGVGTIMTSYNTIDGIPCTANPFLLTEVLREQWGFEGFVFSDLFSIDGIADGHRMAQDESEAAKMAIEAGVDMDLGGKAFRNLVNLLKEGKVETTAVDRAVANVLRMKFRMGLFENPFVSVSKAKSLVRSEEHKQVALQVAREGIVLLKNEGVLPLKKDLKRIAVIGPNANMMYNQLGDYTAPQDEREIITPLEGIRKAVSAATIVDYVKGCAIRDTLDTDIPAAVNAAKQADAVILVVGGSSARDFKTEYIETGAAVTSNKQEQRLMDMDCGEGYDRSMLNLLGHQELLMKALLKVGKPMVVVYIQGRTLNMNLAAEKADALLSAWYPGEAGGTALADILFGDFNPSGRMPVSVPRSEGQLPVYYSNGAERSYMDGLHTPLYAFGYGLSYTHFGYSNLQIQHVANDRLSKKVSCTVTNEGDCDGYEIVQLYLCDEKASVKQSPILLKDFKRIFLRKGESKTVTFTLDRDKLSIYNRRLERVVEPGSFKVMVGAASNDIRLRGRFLIE